MKQSLWDLKQDGNLTAGIAEENHEAIPMGFETLVQQYSFLKVN